jgi:hypothetical protein
MLQVILHAHDPAGGANNIDADIALDDADIKARYDVAHLSTLADVRRHFLSWRPTKEQRKVISAGGRGTYLS